MNADIVKHMRRVYGATLVAIIRDFWLFKTKHQQFLVERYGKAWHVYSFTETVPAPKESK